MNGPNDTGEPADTSDESPVSRRSVLGSAGVLAGWTLSQRLASGTARGARHAGHGPLDDPQGGGGPPDDRPPDCRPNGDDSSPPPGPPALYRDQPEPPQFETTGPWAADPLLVCGTDAYIDGEYLFQDFVYDDNGANTTPTATPPAPAPDSHAFGPMSGDVVYPTGDEYVNNAADLFEVRSRLTDDGRVQYRFTLTTMRREDAAAIAVGIDRTGSQVGRDDWGYGIGSLGDLGLDHVLATWGTGAELDGEPVDDVSVDLDRNQIEVTLPLEPDGATWRHYLVTGLWDGDAKAFKQIQNQPTEDQPGGAQGQNPPPVFNVGFRYDEQEPMGTPNAEPETLERQVDEAVEEATASRGVGFGHWRDHAQSKALADRDISAFHADVDFATLADGVTLGLDDPVTGYHNRIYASNYELDDGDHPSAGIGPYVTEDGDDNNGEDVIRGALVPYALYVPDGYDDEPLPFHVHLHSLSGTYNQYRSFTPNFIREVGVEDETIVMTTTGRGPGVPYDDQAELDVFEAWRDAAHHYRIDADRVTVGGIGTHRLASKYPDLFARGYSIAGSLGDENTDEAFGDDLYKNQEQLAINQRHVPLLIWQGPADELAPAPLALKYEQKLRDLGLRHEFDFFPAADHLAFGYLDEWGPAAEFLDAATVERSPQRVTYRSVPKTHNDTFDLVHDGAYWVSDIEVSDGTEAGLVNARSLGFGADDPVVARFEREGTEPKPHLKRGVEWKDPLTNPARRNELELSLEDVTAVTLWVDEAALDATRPITVRIESTTGTTVTLRSAVGSAEVTVPAGEHERTVTLCGDRPPGAPAIAVWRRDDGSVFTAGQTDQVDVSVTADQSIRVRDRLPADWTVVGGDESEIYTEDGTRYVEFTAPVTDGTRTYFVEAPDEPVARRDTFGPVEIDAGHGWVPVDDTTDTNTVVGVATSP